MPLSPSAAGTGSGAPAASAANVSTVRVLAVLSRFIGATRALGVTEISQDLGMTKNMVHRALTTLVRNGYLVRDAGGSRYELGVGVLQFLDPSAPEPDIRAICQPYLRALQRLSGESVFLSIVVGRNRVNVDSIEAPGRIVTHAVRGRAVPLHLTETSRVLLACLTDEEVGEYIRLASPLTRAPAPGVIAPERLWKDIRTIRRNGYALGHGERRFSERRVEATYLAFPVLDAAGRPHAALTIGGPRERFDISAAEALLPGARRIVEDANRQARLIPARPVYLLGE